MRQDKLSKQNVILYLCGIIPVVWLGLLIAPCLMDGLPGLVRQFGSVMQNPFQIQLCEDSVKTVLTLLLVYGIAIGVYLSTEHNYRRREEHGSAKWGTAGSVNKKYANKDNTENKLLTQNVAIGLDGRKHRRNLNVLVCGGSGAGKTRFYAKPNIMNGDVIFGSEAEDAYNAGEEDCVATFKREMGVDKPYCYIDGKPYTSEELSAMLLKHLKDEAEATIGEAIKDAVITVPAYFYSKEREATICAAETAGLKVKKIIDEPNAAAMAYGLNHWRENANILVYDLGGGTFDVTLVHMGKDGVLSTITTRGNHKLGGRDWDARIEDILVTRFESETGLDIRGDRELLSIVSGMSEGVKKQLSAQNMQATKASALFPGYGKATVTITKAEFEENTADLLDRTGALCLAVLEEAGLSQKDVTDVLLVGGSTRMPQVPAYLQRLFNKRPLSHVNPDEAVALGAAIQSSKENEAYAALSVQVVDGKKTTDRTKSGLSSHVSVRAERKLSSLSMLTLRETTAHAMGVIAINDEGNHYYNEIIIPANHPRPVRAAKKFRFYTSPRTANELAIYVLQGDSENPLDCQITYKYVVTGIKHVNRGEKIGTVIRIQY